MRLLLVIFAILTVQPSHSASGSISCNSNGYVIRPDGNPPFYLGKSCDVYSERMGKGHWCQALDGVLVEFPRGPSKIDGLILPKCSFGGGKTVPCDCASRPLPSVWGGSFAESRSNHTSMSSVIGMRYSRARSIIVGSGWDPVPNPDPDGLSFGSRNMYYERGYIEVEICAPTGSAPCIFYFSNAEGLYLKVQTDGEEPVVLSVQVLNAQEYKQHRLF